MKRDPTPGSGKNEFKELVLSRIKTADARFKIADTPGSRTARGQVFIVLGSPARFQDDNSPRPLQDSPRQVGVGVTPKAIVEGNETTSTWFYDPDRTPRILEVLHRANLQIKIVVEPSKHMDAIQDPASSTTSRDRRARVDHQSRLMPPAAVAPAAVLPQLPRQPLAAAVRQVLESAPASRADGAFAGSAVVFRDGGGAETLLWVFTPRASRKPLFHALIRGDDGREVATLTEPAEISNAFSTHAPGMVAMRRQAFAPAPIPRRFCLTDPDGKSLAAGNASDPCRP